MSKHQRTWILTLLLWPGLVAGAPVPQSDDKIEEALALFNRAKYLHQEKRYDEAVREYERALRLDDKNPWIHNSLGLALTAQRRFKDAIRAFEKTLELNPELTDVYNNIGVVYAEMGEREKAFQAFTRVVRDPDYPTPEKALHNLGELYMQQKNYELALMHFERAVEKQPKFALAHRGAGKARLALGEPDAARASFEKAVELNPEDTESLYELGRIHDQKGDSEGALAYYRRVVEVDRFSTLGKISLARLSALEPGR